MHCTAADFNDVLVVTKETTVVQNVYFSRRPGTMPICPLQRNLKLPVREERT